MCGRNGVLLQGLSGVIAALHSFGAQSLPCSEQMDADICLPLQNAHQAELLGQACCGLPLTMRLAAGAIQGGLASAQTVLEELTSYDDPVDANTVLQRCYHPLPAAKTQT